jgi:hypothetical protein
MAALSSRARILARKVPGETLSPGEVDYVLRRAAEIDSIPSGKGASGAVEPTTALDTRLSVGEVVRLAVEAGLKLESVASALAEVRHGAMVEPETGPLARALGASHIVVSRVVPAPAEAVRRAIDRFMREQLLTVRRHHGDRVEWERAQGIWPGLLRSLDFSKRYGFSLVNHVETTIIPEGDDTAVTFNIDVSQMRRERITLMSARSALAFVLFGLGGTALFPGFGLADALALAGGGIAAGSIFAIERKRFFESRARVALAPERFLDLLVQRRRRLGPGPLPTADAE